MSQFLCPCLHTRRSPASTDSNYNTFTLSSLDTGGVQLCQAAAGGATGSILAHHLCITYRILNEWNAVIAFFNTYEGKDSLSPHLSDNFR